MHPHDVATLDCDEIQVGPAAKGLYLEVGYIRSFLWFLVLWGVLIQKLHDAKLVPLSNFFYKKTLKNSFCKNKQ